jgi:hypothetical protein
LPICDCKQQTNWWIGRSAGDDVDATRG